MPRCKYCHAEILWMETERGKRMPVDLTAEKRVVRFKRGQKTIAKVVDTFIPHCGNCKPESELADIAKSIDPVYGDPALDCAYENPVDPDSRAAYRHWNEEADRVYYDEHPEVFGR